MERKRETIDVLGLPPRVYDILIKHIEFVDALVFEGEEGLREINGIGDAAIGIIKEAMKKYGLDLPAEKKRRVVLFEETSSVNKNIKANVFKWVPGPEEFTVIILEYTGREMFYIQYVIDHGVLYTLEMRYPTANRKECDKIVANVTDSIHYTGSVVYTGGYRPQSRSRTPSSADLDRINACIKYPNYDFMYLDHYVTATVTHKAVYCFRDPDRDVWRDGNFYKVYKGTEVTILAESQGYACVIINGIGDAGWINLDYLSKR